VNEAELRALTLSLTRWRPALEAFTRPATEYVLRHVGRRRAHRVLDVACGVGDPALSLAHALGRDAHVVAGDRVEAFVHEVRREAASRRLTNLRVQQLDMHALPFADGAFDAVTVRFALHAAHDPAQVAGELRRVLCAGGTALIVSWGTPDQPLLRHTVQDPLASAGGPHFAVGEPGPYRFAADGALSTLLGKAGLQVLEDGAQQDEWHWPGSGASLWRCMRETAAPLYDPLLAALDVHTRTQLERTAEAALADYQRGAETVLPVQVRHALALRDDDV
jgi:SAM-dependent methyltransferase